MSKVKLEYVWLDGYQPEPNLRSKVKITELPTMWTIDDIPKWGFDGSSTKQAEGHLSDCILIPVKIYQNINTALSIPTIYVLCEVYDNNNKPHDTNERAKLGKEDSEFWVGFEQEYFIRSGNNKPILGLHESYGGTVDPQGKYYCGVGGQMYGRELSDDHLIFCLNYGINIEGTNAEVAIGQWEYQIFAKGKLKACDDLWMSRYFLYKLAEKRGYQIELHPKPLLTGWNGSGLHTNFSNKKMREEGGQKYFDALFRVFESNAEQHIENYGSDNHLRLTGQYETQSIDKFSYGISDRGASIRVPKSVGETWKGYLEDRRPASNANPYKVINVISESINLTETLFVTLHNMYNGKVPSVEELRKDPLFGNSFISNEELLKEYMIDEPEEINQEMK
jgi:glutamine synthetase